MRRTEAGHRTLADCARLIEAAGSLAMARVAIRVVPFRYLTRVFTRTLLRWKPTRSSRKRAIAEVRWAIGAAAARLPGCTPCLARAFAAQVMLRRRGVHSTLCYGATTAGTGSLRAHAWLNADGDGVVGEELADAYAVLATYSSAGWSTASMTGRC